MNICLVSLPSPFLTDDKVFPNLGVLYLHAALQSRGIEAYVHDGKIEETPQGFSHYGVSATTPQFPLAIEALQQIKSKNPQAKIIIGGPHATVDPSSCLESGFDSVVQGYGEEALPLVMKTGYEIVSEPYHPIIVPNRSAINIHKYKYFIDGREATSVMTSRGCPFSCAFCCKSAGKVTLHPASLVIAELKELMEVYGYEAFMFFDDIFVSNPKRLGCILAYLTGKNVLWRGFVRADMLLELGDDIVHDMALSGCVEVGMGVESGSDKILKIINKGEDTETIKKAVRLLHRHDIRVKGFFIVGLPSESRESVDDSAQLCFEAQFDDVDFTIYQPFKGSHIYENKEKYDIGWVESDLRDMWYKGNKNYHSNIWTSHLSQNEIEEARDYLERRFKK